VTDDQDAFLLAITPTARRQLTDHLPEVVAVAAYEFIVGPLLDNPHRVGKRLRPPLEDRHSARRGTYRVVYRIDDDDIRTVTVLDVAHRRDIYRTGR
jgi:mRNA-degrading endonuclease RelE of RelBE toxin-antitoxin system